MSTGRPGYMAGLGQILMGPLAPAERNGPKYEILQIETEQGHERNFDENVLKT